MSVLVSDLPSRNGWSVAEHAGDRAPDRSQRLLGRASWDEAAAMRSTAAAPGYGSSWMSAARLGKGCFGLDQCQARLYTAILRHIVLVMAALAICAVTAAQLRDRTDAQAPPPARPDAPPPADPGQVHVAAGGQVKSPFLGNTPISASLKPVGRGKNAISPCRLFASD